MPSDDVRIFDLEEELEELRRENDLLHGKISQLAEVIRFYANSDNYPREEDISPESQDCPIANDLGSMAQNALYEVIGY
jgi:hypothetical protein